MMEKYVLQPIRSWRASIEERALSREEDGLRESVLYLAAMMGYDRRVPLVARDLKRSGRFDPKKDKEFLFQAYAQIYIPEESSEEFSRLRTIFGRGSYLLFQREPLKNLANETGVSWQECLKLYRRASQIVADSQLALAKFELTGKT
ncbi:MAG: hypothetical protein AAB492_01115 [Patescibacteria group bacterium]